MLSSSNFDFKIAEKLLCKASFSWVLNYWKDSLQSLIYLLLLLWLFVKYNHGGLEVRKIIISSSKPLRIKETFRLGIANKVNTVQENKQQSSHSVIPQTTRWCAQLTVKGIAGSKG